MAHKIRSLCCVDGRYRRTIGRFVNSRGVVAPKKFLLGTDRNHAELANLRLEQLWSDIERYESGRFAGQPLWNEFTLGFAESIRTGRPYLLDVETSDKDIPTGPAERMWWVRATYPSMADQIVVGEGEAVLHESRAVASALAASAGDQALFYAGIANVPQAAGAPGQSLYRALDAWGESYRARFRQDSRDESTETGRKGHEAAQRLKDSHDDLPLTQLTFAAVERMAD